MKPTLYAALVGLSVVVIFCAGLWVGKATTPEGLSIEEVREYARQESGGGKGKKLPRLEALAKYTRLLGLSESQRRELHPLFADTKLKLGPLSAGNRERLIIITEFHEELEKSLTADQKELAKRVLRQTLQQERRHFPSE
jgi:hypothetical protein